MINDIKEVFESFAGCLTKEGIEKQVPELGDIQKKVSDYTERAGKRIKKMPKFALNPEKFQEKNHYISNKLNDYANKLDEYYKRQRASILKRQMEELKTQISKKIREYKAIDQELIAKILDIGETVVPKSVLQSVKIDEYICDEKALFVFWRTNKKEYVTHLVTNFISMTGRQYDNYIKEIKNVAETKGEELTEKFVENINHLSGTLEKLINEGEAAQKEQEAAKKVLDISYAKMDALEKRIWRSVDE